MSMRCLAVMCHAPAPPHHRLLRARTLVVPCVLTPQFPPCAIPHLTPDTLSILSLLASHPLPTRLSSLSRRSFHPFGVSKLALSNSSHVLSMACVLKRFPRTTPRKIAPAVRETGLFAHGRATWCSTIISMCAPGIAVHVYAMPGRDEKCPCAITHQTPDTLSILSPSTCRHFVVSTPAISNSSRVSFHGVRTKTFSTHVTTYIVPAVRETGLFTHGRATLSFVVVVYISFRKFLLSLKT